MSHSLVIQFKAPTGAQEVRIFVHLFVRPMKVFFWTDYFLCLIFSVHDNTDLHVPGNILPVTEDLLEALGAQHISQVSG